ncbi:MAG: aldo/keto reductase [Deltaproteobacteria bacterium]|nr:aldo/keto reductase [Deltaproteobacteria bacterium]
MSANAASPDGTRRYRDRFAGRLPAAHFRTGPGDLTVASLGIGTYLGPLDDATDALYVDAIRTALARGANVVDTASNYRAQRSERAVGRALAAAIADGSVARDEVLVCSKAGYLPFDGSYPAEPARWLHEAYVAPGVVPADELVGGHTLAPAYLRHQIDRSRANLQVDRIDVYYLHNPESQLATVPRAEVRTRIGAAFRVLEEAVAAGAIGCYGVATWNALRAAPDARDHLALADLVALATSAAGRDHHFRVVQLPCSLAMTEALTSRNQPVGDRLGSLVEAADHHGLMVVASASLLQGKLVGPLPSVLAQAMEGCRTDPQRALQFVRSTPGIATALVGMRHRAHVEENLTLAALAPASRDAYLRLFTDATAH